MINFLLDFFGHAVDVGEAFFLGFVGDDVDVGFVNRFESSFGKLLFLSGGSVDAG